MHVFCWFDYVRKKQQNLVCAEGVSWQAPHGALLEAKGYQAHVTTDVVWEVWCCCMQAQLVCCSRSVAAKLCVDGMHHALLLCFWYSALCHGHPQPNVYRPAVLPVLPNLVCSWRVNSGTQPGVMGYYCCALCCGPLFEHHVIAQLAVVPVACCATSLTPPDQLQLRGRVLFMLL